MSENEIKKKAQVMYKTHITACPGTNIHATVTKITPNLIFDVQLPWSARTV